VALKDLFQGDVTLENNLNAGYEIKKNTTLRADAPRDQGDSVTLDVTIQSIYRMQGAIQHATLMDTVSRVAIYSQLAEVQRAYRRGDSVELHRYAPTFPAFCEMMGLNYQSVKEHLNTYHLLGQEFFEQAERLGIPVREIRILKKLPPKQREKLINAVTSGELTDSEYVKEAIKELASDNVRMHAMLETVSTKEKAELEIDVQRKDTEIDLLKSYLAKEQEKSAAYQERVKELLASRKPDQRMAAIESLTKKIDGILQALDGADMNEEDPVFRAKKEELRAYINRIQIIIG
jgi:Arc/MetJ-type ribon-helix-helix transcriptional regulator